MEFNDNKEVYHQIAHNGYRIRGFIINEVIVIERLMDKFIAKHFSDDIKKQHELIELFISTKRMQFEAKRQVFKYIVDNHYPNVFTEKDKMYSELSKLEVLRNIIAHNKIQD